MDYTLLSKMHSLIWKQLNGSLLQSRLETLVTKNISVGKSRNRTQRTISTQTTKWHTKQVYFMQIGVVCATYYFQATMRTFFLVQNINHYESRGSNHKINRFTRLSIVIPIDYCKHHILHSPQCLSKTILSQWKKKSNTYFL